MLVSYHNHTVWSDGETSVEEMADAAERAGLDELGISDHLALSPSVQVEWSMPAERFADYAAALRVAAAAERSVRIRAGVEADFFPETVHALGEALASEPLDFVIGSVHFVDGFPIDEDGSLYDSLSEPERAEVWRGYWTRVAQLAESRAFDWLAHPDLPRKFGHYAGVGITPEVQAALESLSRAGMAIEVNTAGWHKPMNAAYPSIDILVAARRLEIPLVISSDAHAPAHLTRDLDRARELARGAGFRFASRFERRRRFDIPL